MSKVPALKTVPQTQTYGEGDVLVVFGELFNRGYANGLVEEAQRLGMKVVYSTVGRRNKDNSLRPLNEEELAAAPQPLINIPLEAGFDMDPSDAGPTPVEQLQGYKMSQWENIELNWDNINSSRENGKNRFRASVKSYMQELKSLVPEGKNILFAHIMAGGVPRAKIIMPVMNRVFKGKGDRFIPSLNFLESPLGQFGLMNFDDVTAETFRILLEESAEFRSQEHRKVSYLAYGYHGTEVLHGEDYKWQTYTPYFQGWAKRRLEDISKEYFEKGVTTCVFNCPEILTNSSSIFQGVEVSLYPLLGALERFPSSTSNKVLEDCKALLKETHSFKEILDFTHSYFTHELTQTHSEFDKWPQHNSKDQMEHMLSSSDHLISMHKDPKNLMTAVLSEEVFKSTGSLMLHGADAPASPVQWLGHDVIAEQISKR